ncbi:type VI secretion system protein TssA [Desulfoluna butyratoxydans]|uniref:Type vi secretion evfe evff impa bime vc a0119 vasj n=1 Tax=Desulfoluna butyratoxydans TaxID=231438 RepID=A0A4U8YMW3_9BACT|nr:type VI secretion system protein TssA [Desulfoluna butyratoxydans]VFQ44894.1 type vi secretion evfe evff impa bime vc a0119 vasj [Desulfoluna butyratoxydans]
MEQVALLGKEPISEAAPAGEDVRYEERFEALQEEIDKLSSPTSRDSFSWETVSKLATGILAEDSKDLLVASYLCAALVHLEGWPGLGVATGVFADLLETFWESMYPPMRRMGGRLSAVQWWMEKTDEALAGPMKGTADAEAVGRVRGNLDRIDGFLDDHTDFDLTFGPLAATVERVAPAQEAPAETAAAPPEVTKPVVEASLPTEEVTLDAGNLLRSMAPLFKTVKQASKMVREGEMQSPQSYRWLRFALWEPIKDLPLADGGVTRIPPPKRQVTEYLEKLKDEEAWEELVSRSESQLYNPQHTFLLTLNYFSADALSHLGKRYERAHDMVCRETLLLLRRLDGIEGLRFSDGTPFASDEALAWMVGLQGFLDGQAEGDNESRKEGGDGGDTVADEIQRARVLAREDGKLQEAVEGLDRHLRSCGSGRDALAFRLGLIRLLAEHRQEKMAVAHLERACADITGSGLMQWDPLHALAGLKVIYTVMKKLPGKEHAARAAEILSMIAEISTVDAMNLQSKRK